MTFSVIYRGYVFPEREEDYQHLWKQVAQYFIQHRGALGSCLHKAEDGQWIAYSRWPDRKTRDASWSQDDIRNDLDLDIQEAIAKLKQCRDMDRPHEEICMTVVDDLLVTKT